MWNKYIAIALVGILALAGCQKIEEPIEEEPEVGPEQLAGSYTLTIEATKGVDTKALKLDDGTLNAYWRTDETVAVYLGGAYKGLLTATVNPSDNTWATLSGTLDNVDGVVADAVLTLLFPRAEWDYTGQQGSPPNALGILAKEYDYALASVTVASISGSVVTTTGGANFANQQSIYRFSFKEVGSDDVLGAKGFTVTSANNALVRTRSWSGDAWTDTPGSITVTAASTLALTYASLRNTLVSPSNPNDNTPVDTYSFSVIGSDNALYLGSKDIPASVLDAQGKYITAENIPVTKSNLAQPSGTATEVW